MDKERISSSVVIIHGYNNRGLSDTDLTAILGREYSANRLIENIHLQLASRSSNRDGDSERLSRLTLMFGSLVKSLLENSQIMCHNTIIVDAPCFDFEVADYKAAANRVANHLGELGYTANASQFKFNRDAGDRLDLPDTIIRLKAEASLQPDLDNEVK